VRIIGLTGGIGSGKSTVAGFMADLGAVVVDLDKVGHEVLRSGGLVYKRVIREFGEGILDAKGEIDRARLGELVFRDPAALARLNEITHPAIDKVIEQNIEDYRSKGVKVLVFEAAAVLEAGKAAQFDELWVTTAPETTVLERLSRRSGYSEAESRARLRSQMTGAERVKHADVVIDTDCSLDELRARVEKEWEKLMARSD